MTIRLEPVDVHTIQQRLHDFCEQWTLQRSEDREILPKLLKELDDKFSYQGRREVMIYMQRLIGENAIGLTRYEITDALFAGQSQHDALDKLELMRNRLNATLLQLPSNYLANYQVRIYPSPTDDPNYDDMARIEMLVPTTGSLTVNLPMDRIRFVQPQLRLACAAYDSADYYQAIEQFYRLLPRVQHEQIFTNAEITQFLYYLAKTLLKLNWYKSLREFIDGPFLRFSRLVQKELDSELLEIDGICYRQQMRSYDALICYDSAIKLLENEVRLQPNAKLWLNLADIFVLKAQVRLDHALCIAQEYLVRAASIEQAREHMECARQYYQQYWRHAQEATHYEGRLRGTQAFITIAEAELFPDRLTLEQWDEAEKDARGGFEPENNRKPFGIVAGKYALSMLWLAKGRWLLCREGHAAAERAVGCFHDALLLLANAYRTLVMSGQIYLGERYEQPKVLLALGALRVELQRLGQDPQPLLESIPALDPDESASTQAYSCIYTPLV